MRNCWIWIAVLIVTHALAGDIERFSFPLPRDMDRADVYVFRTREKPSAVLVLCPGCNGSGEDLISQPVWQQFAESNQLGLIAISFASDVKLLSQNERGYYYASQGSGELLLNAVRKIYGEDLPLLLYGFSGGAQFTSRFMEWKPGRVISWCAYSAGWWDPPLKEQRYPPGIVACGDKDERNGASLLFFMQGRVLGNRWIWINLLDSEHTPSLRLEKFARSYFQIILESKRGGCWVDIGLGIELSDSKAQFMPTLAGWLPSQQLINDWLLTQKVR